MSNDFPVKLWIDACLKIADQAGLEILRVYRQEDFGQKPKDDKSPVTDADFAANRVIVAALQLLTPDIAIVSEEEKDKPQGHRVFWLVDPLDGTREFIKRNDEFTVNIALVCDGKPILGVITAPALSLAYVGGVGVVAQRRDANGDWIQIEVSYIKGQTIKIAGSKNYHSDASKHWIAQNHPNAEVLGVGSSLKFCMIAEGTAQFYPRFGRTMEWDTAAGQAILAAAGGRVTTLDNNILLYGKPNFENPDFLARY